MDNQLLAENSNPSPRIDYDSSARGGGLTYTHGSRSIRFYYEMGGGNCMFFVVVPTEEQWESRTKTSLTERAAILQFIAERLKKEQAGAGRFEIDDSQITFYYY